MLAIVAAAGIVTVGSVASNAIKTLNYCTKLKKKFNSLGADEKLHKIERTFYYLRQSGLVKFHGEASQ